MGLIWTLILLLSVTYVWQTLGSFNDESHLCVYADPNNGTHYPNYCSGPGNVCRNTYHPICSRCHYYGSQKFSNPEACESYRTQNATTAFFCFYHCVDNKSATFPNECIDRGRVCQWKKSNCSTPDISTFDNIDKCSRYQKTGIIEDDSDVHGGEEKPDTIDTRWLILAILILVAFLALLISILLYCCMLNRNHVDWCKSMFII